LRYTISGITKSFTAGFSERFESQFAAALRIHDCDTLLPVVWDPMRMGYAVGNSETEPAFP
jgi:hypothetical protein